MTSITPFVRRTQVTLPQSLCPLWLFNILLYLIRHEFTQSNTVTCFITPVRCTRSTCMLLGITITITDHVPGEVALCWWLLSAGSELSGCSLLVELQIRSSGGIPCLWSCKLRAQWVFPACAAAGSEPSGCSLLVQLQVQNSVGIPCLYRLRAQWVFPVYTAAGSELSGYFPPCYTLYSCASSYSHTDRVV